jgi:hypothetical protein
MRATKERSAPPIAARAGVDVDKAARRVPTDTASTFGAGQPAQAARCHAGRVYIKRLTVHMKAVCRAAPQRRVGRLCAVSRRDHDRPITDPALNASDQLDQIKVHFRGLTGTHIAQQMVQGRKRGLVRFMAKQAFANKIAAENLSRALADEVKLQITKRQSGRRKAACSQ